MRQLEAAGWSVLPLVARSAAELESQVREALDPSDILLVVGGDGMVSLGVNIVATTGNSLAVFPAGTGNDFARGLGYDVEAIDQNVGRLIAGLKAEPQDCDLARVTGEGDEVFERLIGGVVSAGFDAHVNVRANRMRFPRGASRYTWAILAELIGLRPRAYRLGVDGVPSEHRAVLISVANNSYMGGGMWVTPQGSLTDGWLDVFRVDPVSRSRLLRLLPSVFRGEHTDEPEVHIDRAREVFIDSPGIVAYADGERLGNLPVRVSVVPAAVRIYRPAVVN